MTCADIIRGNQTLQENFAQLQVPSPLESAPPANGTGPQANGIPKVYVIDGLLDLALCLHNLQAFDMRMAACECLKAYFFNHTGIREHFLRRAIDGHKSGTIESANVLTTLLRSPTEDPTVDPYRYWFAACIMLHLVAENPTTKELARQVTEGNEAEGEEVVTSIQIITSHLIGSLSRSEDERVIIGYLMLLLCWLFEDLDGVNELLEEGSNVQRLIQTVVKNSSSETMVQGLSAMLLGVVYEFSTKDSPVPRGTLQPLLMNSMGRDKYIDKLSKLRAHPAVRDFEMIPQKLDPSTGALPDVFFDATFVEFFKDNYSRILRAIDRDPGMEISVVTNGVQKGISRELVDSLRTQLDEKEKALQECQASVAHVEQQLGQERADLRRTQETTSLELSRVKAVNDSLQQNHEQELKQLREQQSRREAELQKHIDTARRTAETEFDRLQKKAEADLRDAQKKAEADLQAKVQEYEDRLIKMEEEFKKEMKLKDEQHQKDTEEVRKQTEDGRKRRQSEADRSARRAEAEKADLKATISRLEVDLMKVRRELTCDSPRPSGILTILQAKKSTSTELQAAKEASERAEKKARDAEAKVKEVQKKATEVLSRHVTDNANRCTDMLLQLEEKIASREAEKESIQGELDDMLMVYADTEEKLNKYKERLKAKGESISDDEEEEGDEDDDDDEDEDEVEDEEDGDEKGEVE